MNATYTERLETLKIEICIVLERGTFADLPADEYGVTPATRLQWGIDSIEYIIGVARSIEESGRCISYIPRSSEIDNPNKSALAICRIVESRSNDLYVTEGIENIRWVMEFLEPFEDELLKLNAKAKLLEKQVEESEARYQKANREAIRLTMLMNRVVDFYERKGGQW